MALLPAGKLQNVYASLDAYLTEKIVTEAGLALRLHGVRRFVPPSDAAWVEVAYNFLNMQSIFRRQTGGWYNDQSVIATEKRGYLQIDIYERARFWATRYTTAYARDVVSSILHEGSVLLIYDYVNEPINPPEVGALILDGSSEYVADNGLTSGLTQHVLQVQTRYLETFVRQ